MCNPSPVQANRAAAASASARAGSPPPLVPPPPPVASVAAASSGASATMAPNGTGGTTARTATLGSDGSPIVTIGANNAGAAAGLSLMAATAATAPSASTAAHGTLPVPNDGSAAFANNPPALDAPPSPNPSIVAGVDTNVVNELENHLEGVFGQEQVAGEVDDLGAARARSDWILNHDFASLSRDYHQDRNNGWDATHGCYPINNSSYANAAALTRAKAYCWTRAEPENMRNQFHGAEVLYGPNLLHTTLKSAKGEAYQNSVVVLNEYLGNWGLSGKELGATRHHAELKNQLKDPASAALLTPDEHALASKKFVEKKVWCNRANTYYCSKCIDHSSSDPSVWCTIPVFTSRTTMTSEPKADGTVGVFCTQNLIMVFPHNKDCKAARKDSPILKSLVSEGGSGVFKLQFNSVIILGTDSFEHLFRVLDGCADPFNDTPAGHCIDFGRDQYPFDLRLQHKLPNNHPAFMTGDEFAQHSKSCQYLLIRFLDHFANHANVTAQFSTDTLSESCWPLPEEESNGIGLKHLTAEAWTLAGGFDLGPSDYVNSHLRGLTKHAYVSSLGKISELIHQPPHMEVGPERIHNTQTNLNETIYRNYLLPPGFLAAPLRSHRPFYINHPGTVANIIDCESSEYVYVEGCTIHGGMTYKAAKRTDGTFDWREALHVRLNSSYHKVEDDQVVQLAFSDYTYNPVEHKLVFDQFTNGTSAQKFGELKVGLASQAITGEQTEKALLINCGRDLKLLSGLALPHHSKQSYDGKDYESFVAIGQYRIETGSHFEAPNRAYARLELGQKQLQEDLAAPFRGSTSYVLKRSRTKQDTEDNSVLSYCSNNWSLATFVSSVTRLAFPASELAFVMDCRSVYFCFKRFLFLVSLDVWT